MLRAVIVACGLVAAAAYPFSITGTRAFGRPRRVVPEPWALTTVDPSSSHVSFSVAVYQRNLDRLDDIFARVSDPTSPSYGKFLSVRQINELVGQPQLVADVIAWLFKAGVPLSCIKDHGDAVVVKDVPASIAAAVFEATVRILAVAGLVIAACVVLT